MTKKTPRIDQRLHATLTRTHDDKRPMSSRRDQKSVMIDIKMHGFTRELMPTMGNIVTALQTATATPQTTPATPPTSVTPLPIPYGLPPTRTLITVNRSPHGHKKARDQFHLTHHGMSLKGLRRHAGIAQQTGNDTRRAPLHSLLNALLNHPVVQKGFDVKLHITGGKAK